MNEQHLAPETLSRLRGRQLDPAESLAALRHLAGCAECAARGRAGGDARNLRTILEATVPEHLDADAQLIPYVAGLLDAADREIVESHLDDCASCRAEVADLMRFRTASARFHAPKPRRVVVPAAIAAAIAGLLFLVFIGRKPAPDIPPVAATAPVAAAPVQRQPAPPPRQAGYANEQWTAAVDDALVQRRLSYPAYLADLNPPKEVLRENGETRGDVFSPAGEVVDAARPSFSWTPQTGATYVVTIHDDAEVMRSEPLSAPRWRPGRELPRGRIYTWEVEATRDDAVEILPAPPAPPVRFRIVSSGEWREIRSARERFPEDHLLHAVLYARAGMRREAERALSDAVAAGDERAKKIAAARQ